MTTMNDTEEYPITRTDGKKFSFFSEGKEERADARNQSTLRGIWDNDGKDIWGYKKEGVVEANYDDSWLGFLTRSRGGND